MMMKFNFIFFACIFLACSKPASSGPSCEGSPYKGILIRKGCEAYVFQLISPTIKVQAKWTEIFSKKEYENVVSVLNYCDGSPESKILQSLNQGETVSFNLTGSENHCPILCLVFEDSPSPSYAASDIKSCAE